MGTLRIDIEHIPENAQERKDLARVLSWCAETDDYKQISKWMHKTVVLEPEEFSLVPYRGGSHIALHAKPRTLSHIMGKRFAIITNV